jgi:hypothetical protein
VPTVFFGVFVEVFSISMLALAVWGLRNPEKSLLHYRRNIARMRGWDRGKRHTSAEVVVSNWIFVGMSVLFMAVGVVVLVR